MELAMKRLALCLCLLLTALPVAAKEKKLRGYVTAVHSPTSFEIEDYRITRDAASPLEFEKEDDADKSPVDFRAEDIRVGTELEIVGDLDEKTNELRARSVRVILEDAKKINRTALMIWAPEMSRIGNGIWEGKFFADGQWILVNEATEVRFKPNKSERKALNKQAKTQKAAAKAGDDGDDEENDAPGDLLNSLESIGPDTFITYEGIRQSDNTVLARKVEFLHNELEKSEFNMWRSVGVAKHNPPNFKKRKAGELEIANVGKFKVSPDENVQKYINWLGQRLIPPHQKNMPKDQPGKIPFFFFVVEGKAANAFALPNGIVVVYAGMFDVLENEAQLATVVGHEIAHAIQEHSWRQHNYHRKKLAAMRVAGAVASIFGGTGGAAAAAAGSLVEGAIRSGYSRSLENQADRSALESMLAAGYDIREAPRVWQLMSKAHGDGSTTFWSSNDNNTTRRSYLMAELRMNYPDANYKSLLTNKEQFDKYTAGLRALYAKKKKK
jgi:hypothetical protein